MAIGACCVISGVVGLGVVSGLVGVAAIDSLGGGDAVYRRGAGVVFNTNPNLDKTTPAHLQRNRVVRCRSSSHLKRSLYLSPGSPVSVALQVAPVRPALPASGCLASPECPASPVKMLWRYLARQVHRGHLASR